MVASVTVPVNCVDSVVILTRRRFTLHTADLHMSVMIIGF